MTGDRNKPRRRSARETVLDEVRALVSRLSPKAACDDCISERLGLSVRQHANHKTRELTGEPGFKRELDECGLCGTRKLVIRRTWSRLSFARVNRIVKA